MSKNISGRNSVTLIMVIAVIALFLRLAIDYFIKNNSAQNESTVLVMLKSVSTALENYAKDNGGVYPSSLNQLTDRDPAYLNKNYATSSPARGYIFTCSRLEPSGYNCSAVPQKCKVTGNLVFRITTGGVIFQEECSKKE